MDRAVNAIKQIGGAQAAMVGTNRKGIVQSYNPNDHTAKVLIQPEGTLTGWLQVSSQSVGAGWGIHIPLKTGEQVLVAPCEGDTDAGVIIGRLYSDTMQPPSGAGSDVVLRSSAGTLVTLSDGGHFKAIDPAGSSMELTNDGNLTFHAANTLFITCQSLNIQASTNVVMQTPITQISNELDVAIGPIKQNGVTVVVP